MDQVKFVEDSLYKILSHIVRLSKPYHLKFFKACLPKILLGPLLNTLPRMIEAIGNFENDLFEELIPNKWAMRKTKIWGIQKLCFFICYLAAHGQL